MFPEWSPAATEMNDESTEFDNRGGGGGRRHVKSPKMSYPWNEKEAICSWRRQFPSVCVDGILSAGKHSRLAWLHAPPPVNQETVCSVNFVIFSSILASRERYL